MYLYIKSGTNWTPGLYKIASVASNAATLSRACATTAIPTAGTWAVDYTQQNAAQFSGTDLASSNGTNATPSVTSASHTFTQADVGNWIHITAGTNWTTGWFQINSVSAGAATLDRACGSAASLSSGTWAEGGAITYGDLQNAMVAGNRAWVTGSITLTAGSTYAQTVNPPGATSPYSAIVGYTSTRGDGGQVSVTFSTNGGLRFATLNGSGWVISGFNINCSSLATSIGILANNCNYLEVSNCKISNAASQGLYNAGNSYMAFHHLEITGCAGGSGVGAACSSGQNSVTWDSWIHDNTATGVYAKLCSIHRCVISNNSGSTSDGIDLTASSQPGAEDVEANVIYKSGRHGINIHVWPGRLRNNIITDHTAAGAGGLRCDTAALSARAAMDGNVYYNNATHRINVDDCNPTSNSNSTYTNLVYLSGVYTNVFDQFLTGTPFNNAGSNDFTPNATAGAGALVRANGLPGVGGTLYSGIPGLSTSTGFPDAGVFQHQDSGGSSLANIDFGAYAPTRIAFTPY